MGLVGRAGRDKNVVSSPRYTSAQPQPDIPASDLGPADQARPRGPTPSRSWLNFHRAAVP